MVGGIRQPKASVIDGSRNLGTFQRENSSVLKGKYDPGEHKVGSI